MEKFMYFGFIRIYSNIDGGFDKFKINSCIA